MNGQADFWKPKPYDFEAVVAGVDVNAMSKAHTARAAKHAYSESKWRTEWTFMEPHHDRYDRAHFAQTNLSTAHDVWDNRRKVVSA